jgi:hypothetical protein
MGRYSRSPFILEDSLDLCISFLKSRGYMKPNSIRSGRVAWSRRGEEIASIAISQRTGEETGEIVLSYTTKGEDVEVEIQLESIPSNLGVGRVWYFICPHTGERARKLYCFSNGRFLSRKAYKEVYYESQLRSKFYRMLDSTLGRSFKIDSYYDQIYSKGFTKYYKGKKTRRYKKLLAKIKEADSISLDYQIKLEEKLF